MNFDLDSKSSRGQTDRADERLNFSEGDQRSAEGKKNRLKKNSNLEKKEETSRAPRQIRGENYRKGVTIEKSP